MKIELKKIKHTEYLSEETNAYGAELWINGTKAAFVSNRGHGGCDEVHAFENRGHLVKAAEDYCASLPKREAYGMEFAQSLESVCGDILEAHLRAKEVVKLRKKFASKVLFKHEGNIREIGYKGIKQLSDVQFAKLKITIDERYPNAIILNTLNDDQILAAL